MFTIEKIQRLNELEMSVYQYVIQHQNAIPYMRIRELAEETHVSSTTILRFCKKLGCDGYSEFRLKMKESAGHQNVAQVPEDVSELKAFLERLESVVFQKKLDDSANTVALVFSISGEVAQTIRITNQLKRHLCHIISITNTENSTLAQLSELNLAHYITMRRGQPNVDFTKPQIEAIIDYSTQAPALIVAETLAKRVAARLQEE